MHLRPGKLASHPPCTENETSQTYAPRGLIQIRSKIAWEPVDPVSRITLRPHDPTTGEEVEKDEVVRGHEYQRGQYGRADGARLASSKVIDLETFIPRGEVDPSILTAPTTLIPTARWRWRRSG
jgi:hypothetical protein